MNEVTNVSEVTHNKYDMHGHSKTSRANFA